MNQRCSSAVQIAVGVVLGCAFSSFYEKTLAASSAAVAVGTEVQNQEVLTQLKEINTHVKSIDTCLKSGKLKVVSVIFDSVPETEPENKVE